ncbi:hypothetical protein CLV71_103299 [Actinophytocola oryzae]|uniref:Uncharacterized protein n=2 Tax=Actinophytocola oryzae TaxID=502181 RepID=A0A4R7VZG1_9PSEU|nr:hypothetical protein CLV71_103299 [Actinophytocola oryzae]
MVAVEPVVHRSDSGIVWSGMRDLTLQHYDALTEHAPTVIQFKGLSYIFFLMKGRNSLAFCVSSSGATWSAPQEVRGANSAVAESISAPEAIVYQGKLHLFYFDPSVSAIMTCVHDGSTWSAPKNITEHAGVSLRHAQPVVVQHFKGLYVFFLDDGEELGALQYLRLQARFTNWDDADGLAYVLNVNASMRPAICVAEDDAIVVLFRPAGEGVEKKIDLTIAERGETWLPQQPFAQKAGPRPSLLSHANKVYAVFTADGKVAVSSSADGRAWGTPAINSQARTDHSPAVGIFGDELVVLFRDKDRPDNILTYSGAGNDPPTSISDRNHTQAAGDLRVHYGEFGLIVALRSTRFEGGGITAFQAATVRPWATRIRSIEWSLNEIPRSGVYSKLLTAPLKQTNKVDLHFQSAAIYRNWLLLPRNNSRGSGELYIMSRSGRAYHGGNRTVPIPAFGLSHPGGCQVIGDFLAVAVNGKSSSDGAVVFFDLSKMSRTVSPKLVETKLHLSNFDAGCVGITDIGEGADRRYVLAVYTDGKIRVLESVPLPLSDPNCTFSERFTTRINSPGPDSMALLTDIAGNVHLVSLAAAAPEDDSNLAYDKGNKVIHYVVNLTCNSIEKQNSFRVFTKMESINERIYFRFAAGLDVVDENMVRLVVGDRNFGLLIGSEYAYNMFEPTSRGPYWQ